MNGIQTQSACTWNSLLILISYTWFQKIRTCNKNRASHGLSYPKNIEIHCLCWYVWTRDFNNLNIGRDVRRNASVTWMVLSQKNETQCLFCYFWTRDFKNLNISKGVQHKSSVSWVKDFWGAPSRAPLRTPLWLWTFCARAADPFLCPQRFKRTVGEGNAAGAVLFAFW